MESDLDNTDFIKYVDKELGFQIEHPSGWNVKSFSPSGQMDSFQPIIAFMSPEANFVFGAFETTKPISTTELVNMELSYMKKQFDGFMAHKITKLNDNDVRVMYQYIQEGMNLFAAQSFHKQTERITYSFIGTT